LVDFTISFLHTWLLFFPTDLCILSSCLSFALVLTWTLLFYFLCWTNSTFIVVTLNFEKKKEKEMQHAYVMCIVFIYQFSHILFYLVIKWKYCTSKCIEYYDIV
jgi:hypothetical protein